MPAKLYRFHCTDGRELVTDLQGRTCHSAVPVRRHADRVALALMEAADHTVWARWQVEVYDPKGKRVLIRPFLEVDVDAQAVREMITALKTTGYHEGHAHGQDPSNSRPRPSQWHTPIN
ncbi:protein of unassigned function [Methylobacterium oryzae CBMB20]|uniref:Protein of unassigned function n=2 Tax=Methylobacterium oryzae TaxID=334852 RepID=A0A089NXZ2_9HYPH|nr:protein of unassigned function [Methylobacterium oryzae CBMB20]